LHQITYRIVSGKNRDSIVDTGSRLRPAGSGVRVAVRAKIFSLLKLQTGCGAHVTS